MRHKRVLPRFSSSVNCWRHLACLLATGWHHNTGFSQLPTTTDFSPNCRRTSNTTNQQNCSSYLFMREQKRGQQHRQLNNNRNLFMSRKTAATALKIKQYKGKGCVKGKQSCRETFSDHHSCFQDDTTYQVAAKISPCSQHSPSLLPRSAWPCWHR